MRLLILLLLFAFSALNGQTWYPGRAIEWKYAVDEDREPSALKEFESSYFQDHNDIFPWYFESMEWENRGKNPRIVFFKTETEELPSGFFPGVLRELPDDFILETNVAFERKRAVLQLSVFPFRVNPENGKAERLKSFVLKAESDPLPSPKALSEDKVARLLAETQENSPLATGNWYKIRLSQTGMHKISYAELSSMGLIKPQNVRIFGYGGEKLPENIEKGRQDDFTELPVYLNKGADGVFNSGDYLLFYALGTVKWEYNASQNYITHSKNNYSDYGYYFITEATSEPAYPADAELADGEAGYISESYDQLLYHEEDDVNLIESGKEWYGELFDITVERSFTFDIPGLINDDEIMLKTHLLGRAKDTSWYYVFADGKVLDTAIIRYTNLSDYTATHAYTSSKIYSYKTEGSGTEVKLRYVKPDGSAQGWLDYLSINARSELRMTDDELNFRDKNAIDIGVTEYRVQNISSGTLIWDVTDYPAIRNVNFSREGNTAVFRAAGQKLREYVAFNPSANFPSIEFEAERLGKIENQNLKGEGYPDLVIVSYPGFLEEAERLASYRRDQNGLDVLVTTPEIIYNEFSSGRPDVTAIRNYMSWLYTTAGEDEEKLPGYLLLFGDGSYIFKTDDPLDGSFVPTYQSDNSLSPVSSFVSDDFFGLLDDGEDISSGRLDIGIGRLPVSSVEQAAMIVDRIIAYESPERLGEWRNTIVFVGDDEDNNLHVNQADELAGYVETNYPAFNVNKIYLDAFQQISTSVGQRYPEVNSALNDQINKGALIVNYTGHGGTKGLAHERILDVNDIMSWDNRTKLPLFMTATCEFSRYDKPDIVSAGEQVILSENGGGIALLTTTRLVYAGPNHVLNEKFYEIVFEKNDEGKNYCLGEIMQYSKNEAGFGINKRNFTLLGDPAMRLTYPFSTIVTDSINSFHVSGLQDTLKALSEVTVSGRVEDYSGSTITGFNGLIYPTVFDKPRELSTLANDGGSSKSFSIRNSIIYKGKAEVKNGHFHFSFIVPRDINYSFGNGKISYYSKDTLSDASGAFLDLIVGGSGSHFAEDNTGPEIEVFMNNQYFRTGGITDEDPLLFVRVKDENGINTTGMGIGHDITATLNGNTQTSVILNEFYQSDLNSFQGGTVEYPLSGLEPGLHTVEVKVWDIFNNSSTASTEFRVVDDNEMIMKNLMNYPNPFSNDTYFTFEHNMAGEDLEINVDIFSTSGKLIRSLTAREENSGFRSRPIYWDGRGDDGNQNRQGVYFFRIMVKSSSGMEAVSSGRMIIMR